MAKRKKTRQQKIIADLRRKLTIDAEPQIQSTLLIQEKNFPLIPPPSQKLSLQNAQKITPNDNSYAHLTYDLTKTTVITSSLIVIELFIFFLLTLHIIVLPGLSF